MGKSVDKNDYYCGTKSWGFCLGSALCAPIACCSLLNSDFQRKYENENGSAFKNICSPASNFVNCCCPLAVICYPIDEKDKKKNSDVHMQVDSLIF